MPLGVVGLRAVLRTEAQACLTGLAQISIAAIAWVLGLCWAWRVRLIERFLQLDGR
jgi:hypothetical protein